MLKYPTNTNPSMANMVPKREQNVKWKHWSMWNTVLPETNENSDQKGTPFGGVNIAICHTSLEKTECLGQCLETEDEDIRKEIARWSHGMNKAHCARANMVDWDRNVSTKFIRKVANASNNYGTLTLLSPWCQMATLQSIQGHTGLTRPF